MTKDSDLVTHDQAAALLGFTPGGLSQAKGRANDFPKRVVRGKYRRDEVIRWGEVHRVGVHAKRMAAASKGRAVRTAAAKARKLARPPVRKDAVRVVERVEAVSAPGRDGRTRGRPRTRPHHVLHLDCGHRRTIPPGHPVPKRTLCETCLAALQPVAP